MITEETIDRVREAADIVDIIGEHVKLRRAGADFRGPCPFHGGRNPNFSVSPRRNAYKCFKCGVAGDAISFVREHLGFDFAEAVRYVAQRSGIEVKEERRGEQGPDPRDPLWEANAAAAEFFKDMLWIDDEAKIARDYLVSRDVDRDVANRFELGYAPRDGTRLRAHLNAMGYDDDRLVAAGLFVVREDKPEPRSRFWSRLMIPILDASGRHVGFGGRALGDVEPKYLNSPETEVFVKGRMLYGYAGARHAARRADRVLVVEGYFDAIRLALAGLDETVAPLGTALTEQQGALLAKMSKNVFLLYDGDEAGQKATFRAGIELLRHGVSARVVALPNDEDPDTFVRQFGAERLEAHLAQAMDIFERQILELTRRGWFEDLHRKRRAIDRLLPTLRAASDAVTRDLYIGRLGEVSGVDRETLLREVAQPDPRRRGASPVGTTVMSTSGHAPPPAPEPIDGITFVEPRRPPFDPDRARYRERGDSRRRKFRRQEDWVSSHGEPRVAPSAAVQALEKGLIRAMLHHPDQVDLVAERWGPEHFQTPTYRRLFERLLVVDDRSLATVGESLSEPEVAVLNELTADGAVGSEAAAQLWITKLEIIALDEERDRINARLTDPERPLDDAERDGLLARKQQIRLERAAMQSTQER